MTERTEFHDVAVRPFTVSVPLGLRFWDTVAQRVVGGGLNVIARKQGSHTTRPVRAFANRTGTWVLRDLPGLRRFEIAEDEGEFRPDWSSKGWYEIDVADDERRFLPFRLAVQAPQRGYVPFPSSAWRAADVPGGAVPLYPSPACAVPSGMAVIRMQLREPHDGSPPASGRFAAWAVVDALVDGRVAGTSYADEKGRVAIVFPFPAETWPSSPPGVGLLAQQWPVQLRAGYDALPRDGAPRLGDVLAQRPATLWDDSSASQPLTERLLEYGADLVVRSRDADGPPGAEIPELLITQGP